MKRKSSKPVELVELVSPTLTAFFGVRPWSTEDKRKLCARIMDPAATPSASTEELRILARVAMGRLQLPKHRHASVETSLCYIDIARRVEEFKEKLDGQQEAAVHAVMAERSCSRATVAQALRYARRIPKCVSR